MSGPAAIDLVAGALLDGALKGSVVLGAAWVFTRLTGASASERHGVWTVALLSLPVFGVLASSRGDGVAVSGSVFMAIWVAGVVVVSARFGLGCAVLAVREHRCQDRRCGSPTIVTASDDAGPYTWGLLRPSVVLPRNNHRWPRPLRDAVLAHELAHVHRRDWLVHSLVWGVASLFWFHPLVWWARREHHLDAEHAADDVVLASGIRPSVYARALLALSGAVAPAASLGAAPSVLARRVGAVLAERPRRLSRWQPALAGALLLAITAPSMATWPIWAQAVTPHCSPLEAP